MTTELASLSLNPVSDVNQLTEYAFMVQALEAGTIVAVLGAALGWFMVLRGQTFAGHTLSVVSFPGAAGAALSGLPLALGYFGSCGLAALVLALATATRRGGEGGDSATIGVVQAFGLGLGFLFVSLYGGQLANLEALLFGTFLGITAAQVQTLLWVALASLAALLLVGRPLVFASVDPAVARAGGVPVRALSVVFLVLLGMAVAATAQITGALLVFTLLVMPAATAQQLTARPGPGLALSVLLALVVVWVALTIAYFSPYPLGFWATSVAFALYLAARLLAAARRSRGRSEVAMAVA